MTVAFRLPVTRTFLSKVFTCDESGPKPDDDIVVVYTVTMGLDHANHSLLHLNLGQTAS